MNEERLEELLRGAPVPDAEEAERRGMRVVEAAFAQRTVRRRPVLPRLAVVLASGALLTALLLTSAGASVRGWIDDVVTGAPNAEPALTEVPGGGRLLVGSAQGPWVVQPDGSRRLLGRYRQATWSPRGLYVAAAEGRALSAIEPDGTVRWSLSAEAPVADPRWSPSGFRIAYRAGAALRVVVGNGRGDRVLDRSTAPVPAVWAPRGPHLLAYLDGGERLRVVDADSRETVGSAPVAAGLSAIGWSPDGGQILEARPGSVRLRAVAASKLAGEVRLGAPRALPIPAGATVRSAAFSPDGKRIAVLLWRPAGERGPTRSQVALLDPAGGSMQPLFATPGRLSELVWSPDGRHLLIAWRGADQWLFIPAGARGRVRAVGGIGEQFAPGERGQSAFPRVEGWCCTATRGSPTG